MTRSVEELLDLIEQNADRIAVREKVDGKWGSFHLTELPVRLALKHAFRFVRERISEGEVR